MDGTQADATKRILRDFADDNHERRGRIVDLLKTMLADAEYYVAGQTLKIKATTPIAALEEALEYLVHNTFTKMG